MMAELSNDHINYIIKDLNYRGIIAEGIEQEIIDHVCSATEGEMEKGKKFIEAYHEVLKSFGHTGGLREIQKQTLNVENQKATIMLKNYLTIAFRNLRKQCFYSLINIGGLAVGVAACLVIVLFIIDEFSYDKYNTKADRIYRINNEIKFGGNYYFMNTSSAPTAHTLLQDYPEIESTIRFRSYGSYLVKTGEGVEGIKESNVIWADSTFFKIFSIPLLEGDPATALKEPASIAISKRTAAKFFPNGNALGQSLILDNKYNAKVTAVYEDIPSTSHFHFDIIISMVGDWPVAKEARSTVYLSNNFVTYVLLKEGADARALEAKLPGFIAKYVGPQIAQLLGGDFTIEKFRVSGNQFDMSLMPLTDIHLHADLKGEFEANSSITYVYLLGTVALFILAIACINFMNLSTARSGNRAKEVGVRKVMGSLRSHLMRQFLIESTLITVFAFIVAIGIAYLMLPLFNDLALKRLSIPFGNSLFYFGLTGAALLVGVLAGVYPSFFLSAFKPVNVLKGRVARGMKSGFIRSALVVFQFIISIFLIVGAITVNRQLTYIQNKKLGFEKDQVIIVRDAYALRPNKVEAFRNEVLKNSVIQSGSISGYLPVESENSGRNDNSFWKEGNEPTTENLVSIQNWNADYDYIKTFGMKIKLGRDFSSEFPSDSSAVILNETAVQHFELGDDPIGKKISRFRGQRPDGSPDPNQVKSWTVIGVVENFHFSTMREGITSLGLFLEKSDGFVSFRFHASNAQGIIKSIEKTWKKLAPDQPFQYSFLDDDFGKMYASEQRLGKIFALFAGLAIIIACLGLFALTAFTAEQRTKEIGIRKVLGASVSSIAVLLSKEFGKLIVIAFVIATPIAWFGVNWWLKSYAYKAEIGVMVYILAGAFAFVIAWLTMGYQSIRAASSDPVKSLRCE
jgi:putative ABC transport system permease protein